MSNYTVQFHGHLQAPGVAAPLLGREADMVKNNAGAYTFSLGHEARLLRFLVLGADEATYYADKDDHFKQAYRNTEAAIRALGVVAVELVASVSEDARAPKQDAAIFALALCAARGDTTTRAAAIEAIPRVCRIPTHLFSFLTDYKALGGKTGGRAIKRALQRWYLDKPAASVAYAMVKYRQRGGWTHRDVLRLCKPAGGNTAHGNLFAWATTGKATLDADYTRILRAYEAVQAADLRDENVAEIIRSANLPREAIPDTRLKSAVVWRALLYAGGGMPMTALVRNLNRMTAAGVFDGAFDASEVLQRLTDKAELRAARVHPIALLSALRTYSKGSGERGGLEWTPLSSITAALEEAFLVSFDTVEPTGKRFYVGLDVSGSMTFGTIANVPGLTPREASAALALLWAKTEPSCIVKGFTSAGGSSWGFHGRTGLTDLTDTFKTRTLREACAVVGALDYGATQPALIIEDALKNRIPVDVFVAMTDNEVNVGDHPAALLKQYREVMGIDAKLVVIGMTATGFTLADPSDPLMLDMVGFDAATPAAIAAFATGG